MPSSSPIGPMAFHPHRYQGSLSVNNGMLARVVDVAMGRVTGEVGDAEHRRQVIVEQRLYNSIDHGYQDRSLIDQWPEAVTER
jgi:hypothetical protein